MRKHYITTGTITYAIKGRDLLRNAGFDVKIERKTNGIGSAGCGYNIVLSGNIDDATKLLKDNGIKIVEINEI